MRDIFDDDSSGKPKSDEFAALFERSNQSINKKFSVGDKVTGEVLTLGKEQIFVSIGSIHDGVVLRQDLDPHVEIKVGDQISLYVVQSKGSEIRLSTKPTAKNLGEEIEDAFDMMLSVEGKVIEAVKGGFRVQVMGKVAFCPISQMDTVRIETPEEYVGRKYEFRITEYNDRARKFVVSRKVLLAEQRELNSNEFWDKIPSEYQVGRVITGKVVNCASFGAFVEVMPGIQGLIPLGEMSYTKRVVKSDDLIKVGDQVQVMIKDILPEQRKMTLSLKEAGADPWALVPTKFPIGTMVSVKAVRRENFGILCEVTEGVTGLLPKSKALAVSDFPYDKIKVGDMVEVHVLEVDSASRRMTLGPKDESTDLTWKEFGGKSSNSFGTLADQFKTALQPKKK